MANLLNYIQEYGDRDFKNKAFNDIDNLVFSELSYLDFSNTSINRGKYTLEYIGLEYLNQNKYQEIKKLGIAQRDAYKLLRVVVTKKRYQNIILSNYIYNTNKDKQFSAITFKIHNNLKYICFEGTDERISGWKEDGELACFFPIPSHIDSINYVNENVKLLGPNVIIGGHSKGGNLALVSAMYMKKHKKIKVKKVYSNDGPGLRKKEFESAEYKQIKKKYVHIVPNSSIVGVLLRNDSYKVIKSTKNNIFGHAIATWKVEKDCLVPSELSPKSKRLEKSIISWLDKHNDEERLKIIHNLFKALEDADITDIPNATKAKNLIKIIHNIKNIDKQTKELIKDLILYNYKNVTGLSSLENSIANLTKKSSNHKNGNIPKKDK